MVVGSRGKVWRELLHVSQIQSGHHPSTVTTRLSIPTPEHEQKPLSQALRTLVYRPSSSHILHKHTMVSRAMSMPARRLAASLSTPAMTRRSFQSSARLLEVPAGAMPVRKPVGAFRGGYETYQIALLAPSSSCPECTTKDRRVT